MVSSLVVGVVLDRGGEEGVDEGRLSQARLSSNLGSLDAVADGNETKTYHDGEGSTTLGNNLVPVLR